MLNMKNLSSVKLFGSISIASLVLMIISGPVFAGSWMRSESEYLYHASFSHSSADQYYDNRARLKDADCKSSDLNFNQAIEYGYSYYYTLFADISLEHSSCGGKSENDLGDLEVGIRGRINLLRNGRSWEVALIIPTDNKSSSSSNLGAGEFGIKLGLHGRFAAGGTVQLQHYITVGTELRFLSGSDASDRLLGYINYSLPRAKFDIDLGFRAERSIGNNSIEDSLGFSSVTGDYQQHTIQASLSHKIEEWSLRYKISKVVWGKNTDASSAIGISLSRTWND